ncbi:MAG: hypothetical protein WBD64_06865 [Candidatus Zixiibacteriota bacterium]
MKGVVIIEREVKDHVTGMDISVFSVCDKWFWVRYTRTNRVVSGRVS